MTDNNLTTAKESSFKDFLLKYERNKITLFTAALAVIIQFGIFKYLYPYANYIHGDSFSYLTAASENLTINTYLIGYSKFLRFVSIFAKPDIVLVAIQYLLIQSAGLFFLFTLLYFYKPSKIIRVIFFAFIVLNPLCLHLANLVSSDGIFLALSLFWFSLLLWIIHQPSNKVIYWHAFVIFLAFTVRYNAMIYPLIAIIAFYLSRVSFRKKVLGLGIAFLLCGWFVGMTMHQYKKLTGHWQYSPFSGWQFANNAMYAYRYVDSADREPPPARFKKLDKMVTSFYDKTRNVEIYPSEQARASTFYMWSKGMPLMQYRDSLFKTTNPKAIELKKWATMGPLYKDYGIHLIKTYPFHFLAHFVWPNMAKYYAPPVEFLSVYNTGNSHVTHQAKQWFGYKSNIVKTRMKNPQTWALEFLPILSGIINVLMFFGLMYYILLKGWRNNLVFNKTIVLASVVWLLNAVFTISASSAALRFQSFPIILTTIFAFVLVDWMLQLMKTMKSEQRGINIKQPYSNEIIA